MSLKFPYRFSTHRSWRRFTQEESDDSDHFHEITTTAAYAFCYVCILVLVTGSVGPVDLIGALIVGMITTSLANRSD